MGINSVRSKEQPIALLKLLALGEKDRLAGLGPPVEESHAQLAQRRKPR